MSFRLVALIAAILKMADGHGRLIEPPSRSSMWRFGFDNPPNYNDNQLFCGGFATQFNKNGGKCGVCGDSYDGPLDNEGPDGKYAAKGIIVRSYKTGQVLHTSVDITANHKGYFQFKLCRNDLPAAKVTQECFDEHLLTDVNGNTELTIADRPAWYNHSLRLPPGLTCKACVLQWRYNTGNSWGTDPETGKGCIGCGDQEQFYGCADIAIGESVELGKPSKPSHPPPNPDAEYVQTGTDGQAGGQPCNCPCSEAITSGSSLRMMLLSLVLVMYMTPF